MKNARRVVSILLALVLVAVTVYVQPVKAAENNKIDIGVYEAGPGKRVTVEVELTSNSGMAGIQYMLNYDASKLKFIEELEGDKLADPVVNTSETGKIYYVWSTVSDKTSKGIIVRLVFEVSDKAKAGENLTITASDVKAVSTNGGNHTVDLSVQTGIIKVTCAHQNTNVVTTYPTCVKDGAQSVVCKDCGKVLDTVVIKALGHKYDAGNVTTPATATQNGVKTYTCERCSDKYTETIYSIKASLSSKDQRVCPGDTVNVTYTLDVNPGMSAMQFCVNYDTDAFELVDTSCGMWEDAVVSLSEGKVVYVFARSRDTVATGDVLTLTFKALDGAIENKVYEMTLTGSKVCNQKLDDIYLETKFGGIKVEKWYVKGDINGDDGIDIKDAVIAKQLIAGINVEGTTKNAADINKDGVVDVVDAVMIMQWIAGVLKEL